MIFTITQINWQKVTLSNVATAFSSSSMKYQPGFLKTILYLRKSVDPLPPLFQLVRFTQSTLRLIVRVVDIRRN
jgi:hypothetical protein